MKNTIILVTVIFAFSFNSCNSEKKKQELNIKESNKEVLVKGDDKNTKNLIGTWNWRSDDKSQEFTIKIKRIEKDSVFGQYCAIYNNGGKIDCDFDDINNIKGLIVKDKIQLSFNSFFGAKNGKAEIKFFDNYIEWKIIKEPKGEYYSPQSATLSRKSNKSLASKTDLSTKKVKLPFDYEKYMDVCYLKENTICDEKFPSYKSNELLPVTKLINQEINKNEPDRIYCIDNLGLDFETYVFMIKDEIEDYISTTYLINIKNNKIIAKQLIGQNPDGEAPEDVDVSNQTFVINKDLSVSVFDIIYKKKNKLSITYLIKSDGSIKSK